MDGLLAQKDFSELYGMNAEEPWRVFRIMSEFIDSFETMAKHKRLVSVFGSARTKPEDPVYQDCVRLGELLTDGGYGVLTGGGPGIMAIYEYNNRMPVIGG